MASFIKSKDNATKDILNLFGVIHIIFIHSIELGITVVNSTANH